MKPTGLPDPIDTVDGFPNHTSCNAAVFSRIRHGGKLYPIRTDDWSMAPAILIAILLAAGRPPAIFGEITFAVVNAVQRQAVRPVAHVGIEIFKGLPTFADAPILVFVVADVLRISASASHRNPASISPGPALSTCLPMDRMTIIQTPARSCLTASKIVAPGYFRASAVATAQPVNDLVFGAVSRGYGDQSTKALSGNIFEIGHDNLSSGFGSSDGLALQRQSVAKNTPNFTADQCRVLKQTGVDTTGICPPKKEKK